MKKIIDGKLYDTEDAEEICERRYLGPSDFNYIWEFLFKSSAGQFFISYEGGAATGYAVPEGRGHRGGAGIKLISVSEAKEFVEEYGTYSDYANTFGEPERG